MSLARDPFHPSITVVNKPLVARSPLLLPPSPLSPPVAILRRLSEQRIASGGAKLRTTPKDLDERASLRSPRIQRVKITFRCFRDFVVDRRDGRYSLCRRKYEIVCVSDLPRLMVGGRATFCALMLCLLCRWRSLVTT